MSYAASMKENERQIKREVLGAGPSVSNTALCLFQMIRSFYRVRVAARSVEWVFVEWISMQWMPETKINKFSNISRLLIVGLSGQQCSRGKGSYETVYSSIHSSSRHGKKSLHSALK